MKKFILISLIICMISGCSFATSTHVIEKDFSKEQIIEVDYTHLQEKIQNKDSFVLYIGRPDCRDCQEFEPYLKEYRDLANKENASQEDKDFYDRLYDELNFSWTPTLNFIYQGENEESYTYLDKDYYSITDEKEKKEKKQEYIDLLSKWLNRIFVEEK